MRNKLWILRSGDEEAEKSLVASGIPTLSAKVLSARKIRTPELAHHLFCCTADDLPDPMLLPDMPEAATRLRLAIEQGQRVVVHGDHDVDGITATALLTGWLRAKGVDCKSFIPGRVDGYGVTPQSVERVCECGAQLIVTVDSGSTACSAAERAAELGVDMVITDHHECTGERPAAVAVVNPQRGSVARELAGVGVAFMLALAVDGAEARDTLIDKWSDLVALGTIADVAPMIGSNRALCSLGMERIRRMERPGLKALAEECKVTPDQVSSRAIAFSMAPRLNAAGRMDSASDAVELMLTQNRHRAEELTKRLCEMNRQRQAAENMLLEQIASELDRERRSSGDKKVHSALVFVGKGWQPGIAGIAASRMSERYARPVFMISVGEADGLGKGSVRSAYGVSILELMRRAEYLFENWGGHEYAAGFTIKEENIPLFRELVAEFSLELPVPHIYADAMLDPELITPELVDGLEWLEPFGLGNEPPLFILPDVEIDSYVPVGWGHSARMIVRCGGREFPAFCFGTDPSALEICDGDRGDALCLLSVSTRRGERQVTLVLRGIEGPPEEMSRFISEMVLFRGFKDGHELTREQAQLLMPKRGDFVGVLRHLKRGLRQRQRFVTGISAMCRRICREEHLQLGYARIMVCLEAFAETGVLEYRDDGETVSIDRVRDQQADLRRSPTLARLREKIGEPISGSRAGDDGKE